MKVTGKKIRLMATAFMCMSMEPGMRDTGRVICKMAMEWSRGLTAASTKEDTKKA